MEILLTGATGYIAQRLCRFLSLKIIQLYFAFISAYISVPTKGCFRDVRTVKTNHPDDALKKIFAIGGNRGWYYANWLWNIRGFMDKMVGGIGIRRGRKNDTELSAG